MLNFFILGQVYQFRSEQKQTKHTQTHGMCLWSFMRSICNFRFHWQQTVNRYGRG